MKVDPSIQVSQHQWQDNVIKAQNFIYNFNSDIYPNVIVGSSLSNRLVMDSLKGYFNLSFVGLSISDGLIILNHSKNLPKNVFIEINESFKKEDKNFTSSLFNPFLYCLRKYIPSVRDGKQPIAIAGKLVLDIKGRIVGTKTQTSAKSTVNKIDSKQGDELFLNLLNGEAKAYSKSPSPQLLEEIFNKLHTYIEFLRKKGVNIFFFEMPVDNKLCSLPLSVTIRETFYKNFPAKYYNYIPQPNCSEYKTTDGIHLDEESALGYTIYFKEKTKNYSR